MKKNRIIGVEFLVGTNHNAPYDYIAIKPVSIGDIVLVPVKSYGKIEYKLAKVVVLDKEPVYPDQLKPIVDIIDFAAYDKYYEVEKQKAEIKKQMEKRKAELEEIAIFEMLAKQDPTMAEMLAKLKEIENEPLGGLNA